MATQEKHGEFGGGGGEEIGSASRREKQYETTGISHYRERHKAPLGKI